MVGQLHLFPVFGKERGCVDRFIKQSCETEKSVTVNVSYPFGDLQGDSSVIHPGALDEPGGECADDSGTNQICDGDDAAELIWELAWE